MSADPQPSLGPTDAKNWGWIVLPGGLAVLLLAGAAEAMRTAGLSWASVSIPILVSLPLLALAVWAWHQPPFYQITLTLTETGVEVAGRRDRHSLGWNEIASVSLRPSAIGPAHFALDRHGQDGSDAPGILFPVAATGARAEDIVAFLANGAAQAGYRLEDPVRDARGDRYRLPGPRRWVVLRP